MKRGRKPGVKVGPTPGSRPWQLVRLPPGKSLLFVAPSKRVGPLMQQIAADMSRNQVKGRQEVFIAVQPTTLEVIQVVRVTKEVE